MARGNVSVKGINGGNQEFRVAASATRGYSGDPVNNLAAYTNGVADTNTCVVLTDAKPRIGTDQFVGVERTDMAVNSAGTVTASKFFATVPIPFVTRLSANLQTVASMDTDTELLGLLWDYIDFNLAAGVYTLAQTAASDASGLIFRNGDIVLGTADVVVDPRCMRADTS